MLLLMYLLDVRSFVWVLKMLLLSEMLIKKKKLIYANLSAESMRIKKNMPLGIASHISKVKVATLNCEKGRLSLLG